MIPGGDFCLVSKLRMASDDRSFLGRYGRSKVVNLRSCVFDGSKDRVQVSAVF